MPQEIAEKRARHWARTRNLTIWVLAVWFIFAFVTPWFAKELNAFSFLGFKLGYYLVVQGSLIVFVAIIWISELHARPDRRRSWHVRIVGGFINGHSN